ncbi:MAG: hypothetical protein V1839_00360 [archaeon]
MKIKDSNKAQLEKWIAVAIFVIVAAVLIIYMFVTGMLPRAFGSSMNLLGTPSAP